MQKKVAHDFRYDPRTKGTGSFSRLMRPGRDPPSNAEVTERVELYISSPSGPSRTVLGWTAPSHFLHINAVRRYMRQPAPLQWLQWRIIKWKDFPDWMFGPTWTFQITVLITTCNISDPHFIHTVYLRASYKSHKMSLFPSKALDWSYNKDIRGLEF